MLKRISFVICLFLILGFVASSANADGILRKFFEPKSEETKTEDIKILVKLYEPVASGGKCHDHTKKKSSIKGTVDIPPGTSQAMKNELIENAVQKALNDAEASGQIPAGAKAALVVDGNQNSYVSVDEKADPEPTEWSAVLKDWTCTNKSDQKPNKRINLTADGECASMVIYRNDDALLAEERVVQFGFENEFGFSITVDVAAYENGSFKPLLQLLSELAQGLQDLSVSYGTPVFPQVYYINDGVGGIFFDHNGDTTIYGDDVPWLDQDQASFPVGHYGEAKNWIGWYSDTPLFFQAFVIEVNGVIYHVPLRW